VQLEQSCFMRTDRQTNMEKLIVNFRNFETFLKTNKLIFYKEIIAVCSEIHTKHINALCGQNVALFER